MTTQTATRQDVHAPRNLDPSAYRFVGMVDLHDAKAEQLPDGSWVEIPNYADDPQARAALAAHGLKGGNFDNKGTCDHCGAWFLYGAVFMHRDGDAVCVGWQCAGESFNGMEGGAHQIARMKKAAAARRHTIKMVAAFMAQIEDRDDKAQILAALESAKGNNDDVEFYGERIARSMKSKIHNWGKLSDKQIALLIDVAAPDVVAAKRQEKEAAEAKRAEEEAARPDVVEGRRVLVGTVATLKVQESDWGSTLKMLLICDDGQKLWGSVPSAIRADIERGDAVEFTATVEASQDDPKFGFYKRPSKAKITAAA